MSNFQVSCSGNPTPLAYERVVVEAEDEAQAVEKFREANGLWASPAGEVKCQPSKAKPTWPPKEEGEQEKPGDTEPQAASQAKTSATGGLSTQKTAEST